MDVFKNIRYINRGLSVLVATLFIVTIVSTVYLTRTILDSRTLITDGTNTVSAVLLLQDLELNIKTAESSERGYIITGDDKYLETYNASIKLIPQEQKALASKAYGIKTEDRETLNKLIDQRKRMLNNAIEVRRTQGVDAAIAIISNNRGLEVGNQIENLSKNITREKFEPFTGSIRMLLNSLRNAVMVAATMIGFVLIISIFLMIYFQRAIAKERATEGVKSEFLSLASHQLRTPASNIKQYLGLLLEGYLGKLKPEQKDAIEVANRNNDIGIHIINDLLGVAKLDLDKIRLKKKQANIYVLIREVVDDYRPLLKERKQAVKFERAFRKAEAEVDVYYLKSVFENLIDNASKYSPKKSSILIRIEQTAQKTMVSIKDEGVGIKRNEKSKLFKKFSRIPNNGIHNNEGSGLGLYWVKRIVELHGGRINVKSRHGKGSTFIIELPNSENLK
jgi:signal transduction histidine kinase